MRLFVALPLPDIYQQACLDLVSGLGRRIPGVKWVAGGNFHITLKFIGEVEDRIFPAAVCKTAKALRGGPSLTLSLRGTGAFPKQGNPRIIWAGVVEEAGFLPSLAEKLDVAFHELGISREKRPFVPHVTLGRVRPPGRGIDRRILEEPFSTEGFQIIRAALFQSTLTREGPLYKLEKKFPLG